MRERVNFVSDGRVSNLIDTSVSHTSSQSRYIWEEMATKNSSALVPVTTGGLGHHETKWYHGTPNVDHEKLTDKMSDQVTQKHLDKIVSVQIVVDVHDRSKPKEQMLYFLKDGPMHKLTKQNLLITH